MFGGEGIYARRPDDRPGRGRPDLSEDRRRVNRPDFRWRRAASLLPLHAAAKELHAPRPCRYYAVPRTACWTIRRTFCRWAKPDVACRQDRSKAQKRPRASQSFAAELGSRFSRTPSGLPRNPPSRRRAAGWLLRAPVALHGPRGPRTACASWAGRPGRLQAARPAPCASSINRSSGSSRLIRPHSSAFSPAAGSASSASSRARVRPISARQQPGHAAIRHQPDARKREQEIGRPGRHDQIAHQARLMPIPTAGPFIAVTIGM